MNMPKRGRNYHRFPCELTEHQINTIRERADKLKTTYAAFARALIDHSLSCPLFLAETSSEGSIQSGEGTSA